MRAIQALACVALGILVGVIVASYDGRSPARVIGPARPEPPAVRPACCSDGQTRGEILNRTTCEPPSR